MRLSANWLCESPIDLEYKQYAILSYMQEIDNDLSALKLFPEMLNLKTRYFECIQMSINIAHIDDLDRSSREVDYIDYEQLKIVYKNLRKSSGAVEIIKDIIDYAIPVFEEKMKKINSVYSDLKGLVSLQVLGIASLNAGYGYIIYKQHQNPVVQVYEYQDYGFYDISDGNKYIKLDKKFDKEISSGYTLEELKKEIVLNSTSFLPCIYLVESTGDMPFDQTFFHLGKELLRDVL